MSDDSGPKNLNTDIQVLRAFAVLVVLSGHNYLRFIDERIVGPMSYISTWVGVDVFFVISGYIITYTFLTGNRPQLTDDSTKRNSNIFLFWIRRIYRIWPGVWFWAISTVIIQYVCDANYDPTFLSDLISTHWAALLQINNFHQYNYIRIHGHWTHGGIFWSLSLEEQFYIFFPLAITFLRRRIFVGLSIILIGIQFFIERNSNTNILFYFFRTDALLVGVLVAIYKLEYLKAGSRLAELAESLVRKRIITYLAVPFILVSMLVLPSGLIAFPYYTGLVALLGGVVIFIASFNLDAILPRSLLKTVLLWVGSRSYSIYLCQLPYIAFCYWVIRGRSDLDGNRLFKGALVCGVFVVAELSYRFVEKPFISRGSRLIKRLRSQVAAE